MPTQVTTNKPKPTKNGGAYVMYSTYPTSDQLKAHAKQWGCKSRDLTPKPSNTGSGFMVFKPTPWETETITIDNTDE